MKRHTGQDRTVTTQWRPATQAVRGGTARSEYGETSEAIFLTSGYAYDCAADAAARFAGEQQGMTYSRLQNPTVEMLEQRIALLEGAEAARCMATGMAAMTAALLCQLSAGDHMVGAKAAFGSCRWLTDSLLPRFGIATTVIDSRDTAAWEAAIRPETKVFFFEDADESRARYRRHRGHLRDREEAWHHHRGRQRLCHTGAAATDGLWCRRRRLFRQPR